MLLKSNFGLYPKSRFELPMETPFSALNPHENHVKMSKYVKIMWIPIEIPWDSHGFPMEIAGRQPRAGAARGLARGGRTAKAVAGGGAPTWDRTWGSCYGWILFMEVLYGNIWWWFNGDLMVIIAMVGFLHSNVAMSQCHKPPIHFWWWTYHP